MAELLKHKGSSAFCETEEIWYGWNFDKHGSN